MRHRSVAVLVAAVLAVPLVAADHTGTPPTGTASTSMTAIELEVTGLPGLVVLDGATSATTVDTPWGGSSVTGLRLGTTDFSTAEAASDASTSDDTALLDVETTATGWVGAVNPLAASAGADTNSAWSLFDAANVDLAPQVDLGDLATGLGVGVHGASAESRVDDTSASATQSLTSASFHLTLGGLVEALEQLPLDTVLALIDELGLELPVDPTAAIDAVQEAVDAVVAAEGAVVAAGGAFVGPVAEHVDATGNLATVSDLQDTYDDLATLLAAAETNPATVSAGDILAVMDAGELAACGVEDLTEWLLDPGVVATLQHLLACVAAQMEPLVAPFLDDPADFDPAQGHSQLEDAIAGLEATIAGLVAALDGALGDLADAVAALEGVLAAGDLATLLDAVEGLLDDLVATPLVEISELSISIDAIAAGTVEESSATIGCTVEVAVLGTAVGPQTCDGTIEPVLGTAAVLDAAIDDVRTLLSTLPLDPGVDLAGVTLDAFADPTDASVCVGGAPYQRVCEVDGTVHAVAGIRLLDVAVPTMTIDPALATDAVATALDGALEDVAALEPDATVDDTLAAVATLLDGAGLGTLDDGLPDGGTVAGSALGDAQGTAAGIATDLAAGTIGTLSEPVDTPAVSLSIDPVSVASFTAGVPAQDPVVEEDDPVDDGAEDDTPVDAPADDDPVDGAPDPGDGSPGPVGGAPDPDVPNLPHTGGGLALAGLMSLLGAAALRRRW